MNEKQVILVDLQGSALFRQMKAMKSFLDEREKNQ